MAKTIVKDTEVNKTPVSSPDTKAVGTSAGTAIMYAETRRKDLVKKYTEEPRVPVILAPQYAVYFGNVMRVTINGISIAVRVDGSTQKVPQTFADEIHRRRRLVDKQLLRMKRMANIPVNAEKTPGELTF